MPVVSFSQADCTEAPVVIGVVQRTLEHWWVGSPLQYGAFVRYSCSKEEGMEPDQGRIAEDGQLTMSDASWEQARNRASVIYSSANRSIAHVSDVDRAAEESAPLPALLPPGPVAATADVRTK